MAACRVDFDSLSILEAALAYARAGLRVFPVIRATKRPLTDHGAYDGTTDEAKIREWWKENPGANVAIALDGLVLVDFDPRHGAPESRDEIIATFGPWPDTAEAITGSGGRHLYFRARNRLHPAGKLSAGVDCKSGPGCYAVAPPSIHASERRYTWDGLADPLEALRNLPPAPDWVYRRTPGPRGAAPDDDGGPIPEGQRNETLFRLGCALRRRGLSAAAIEAALLIENRRRCQPPLPDDEVKRVAESAGRYPAGNATRIERIVTPDAAEKIEVEVRPDALAEIVEQCEQALAEAEDSDIYQCGGRLVYPARESSNNGTGASYLLATLDADGVLLRLLERFRFVKPKPVKGGVERVPTDVPAALPRLMLARRGRWRYRYLRGVVSVPVIRPDGSFAAQEGYDSATGLLLVNLPDGLQVPERPTPADAVEALRTLSQLLRNFPFESETDATAALSALMSAVLRPSLGPVPLHLFTAPVAGSGKTYLYEICGALATGMRPAVLAAAGLNAEELDKRVAAVLLAGRPLLCLDNLSRALESGLLCQVVASSAPLELRRLGTYDSPQVESVAACYATGNNITVGGDMLRRVIPVRLDPRCERPELRSFDFNPLEAALRDRGRYLTACFTIVLAYRAAGMPDKLAPLASFERWNDLVRSALHWLTRQDCCDGMEALRREDPGLEAAGALLQTWHDAFGAEPVAAKEVIAEAGQAGREGLRDALLAVAGKGGVVDARRLGYWLRAWKNRIVGGLLLEPAGADTHAKARCWRVRSA